MSTVVSSLADDLASAEMKQIPSTCNESTPNVPTLLGHEMFDGFIPLIDMEGLQGPKRSQIIKEIGHSCQYYGFFLVKNHGIPETKINNMLGTTRDFFRLPEQEKLKFYSTDHTKSIHLRTGSKKKTKSRDALTFSCHPVEDYVVEWPSTPPSFRKSVTEYCTSVKKIEFALLEAISESLGLERDYIDKKCLLKLGQKITMNYYPTCQHQNLEFTPGIQAHTDPTIITILLQDNEPGLQAFNNGKWMEVNPIPNTFAVHVGDLLQVISNYQYKSLHHRVFLNGEKERISVVSYCYPSSHATIGPAAELIDNDHPSIYKNFTYGEFYEVTWKVEGQHLTDARLDSFKSSSIATDLSRN